MALNKGEKIGVFLAVVLAFAFFGLSFVFFGDSRGLSNPLDSEFISGDLLNNMNEEGLNVSVLAEGEGEVLSEAGNTLVVHYVGALEDGTVFDSSLQREQAFEFTLGAGQVIRGWDIGLEGMAVGEVRRLEIAPELGYGDQTVGPIPANSTLIFEVQLLEIK